MKKTINTLLSLVVLSLLISCQDDEVNDYYNQRVNLLVDITLQDNDLASSGTAKSITQARLAGEYVGFGGLLLYRSSIPVSSYPNISSLYAFDLACPVEKVAAQKVHYIGGGKAKCDKCGTEYDLTVGLGNATNTTTSQRLVTYTAYYLPTDHVQFKVLKK